MNNWRVRLVLGGTALAALLLWVESAPAQTQTNAAPQILFLHLKLTQKGISLVASSVQPGLAKPQPNLETKEIQFELVSALGQTLWPGAMDDPRTRRVEFEDPPRSGRLKRKAILLKEAEFTIRVPFLTDARRIDFYTLDSAPTNSKSDKPPVRKLLGSVPLPVHGKPMP
jgi:hypothetical protein